eukprot:COSAG02_NODE_14364_length_1279_cov_13.105932_1_plen_21_part_10
MYKKLAKLSRFCPGGHNPSRY